MKKTQQDKNSKMAKWLAGSMAALMLFSVVATALALILTHVH